MPLRHAMPLFAIFAIISLLIFISTLLIRAFSFSRHDISPFSLFYGRADAMPLPLLKRQRERHAAPRCLFAIFRFSRWFCAPCAPLLPLFLLPPFAISRNAQREAAPQRRKKSARVRAGAPGGAPCAEVLPMFALRYFGLIIIFRLPLIRRHYFSLRRLIDLFSLFILRHFLSIFFFDFIDDDYADTLAFTFRQRH
jgi:hypothetical protein